MKKIIIIITLILVAFSLIFAQDTVALTLKVKGDVKLDRAGKNSKIKTGEMLLNNDQLESKEDSYAAVKFVDGSSIVKLFPNSILRIKTEKKENQLNKKSYLQVGNLWSKVIKKTGVFEIETPTTVVSVKGTNFLLKVDENGFTELYTLEGKVKISNKKNSKSTIVTAGNKAKSDGKNLEVSKTEKSDLDKEILQIIEDEMNSIRFEIKDEDGESKNIKIDFE
ncbi:MAG: FecR family protein [Candidatus Cloacimonetes bacterium]|nr:FecR family protein [Candidatus Cloacimonadota bacterium]